MSTPDTAPEDRPLTITEIEENQDPLFILADRLLPYLGPDWRGQLLFTHDVMLLGPDEMKILLTPYGDHTDYDPRQFYIGTYTATGRPHGRVTDSMNIFTLPSQIAAHLTEKVIPATRQRLIAARKQQSKVNGRNEVRKARIAAIAQKLNWNATGYDCQVGDIAPHSRQHTTRRRPPGGIALYAGRIGYDKNGMDMSVYLDGIPEDLADQIADVIAAYPRPIPEQLEPSSPKKRRNDMKIESIDNRGDQEVAFGYVYFDDGARVGYANIPDKDTGEPVWQLTGPGSGHWKQPNANHNRMALAHLKEHGAKVPEAAPEESEETDKAEEPSAA